MPVLVKTSEEKLQTYNLVELAETLHPLLCLFFIYSNAPYSVSVIPYEVILYEYNHDEGIYTVKSTNDKEDLINAIKNTYHIIETRNQ